MSRQTNRPKALIAVCGKGGVGKTSVSAMMIKILARNGNKKILAIDADPAAGLSFALGISAEKTVDDVRNRLIQRLEHGEAGDTEAVVSWLEYETFETLVERQNIGFLAIGRPEKEGCYCQVNHILKDIIASMAGHFDYVVIDGEAGIEQVNRRVMETVSHMVLVADPSAKALHVAKTIQQVAKDVVDYKTSGLIVNRCRTGTEEMTISIPQELQLISRIPEDDAIRTCDIQGGCILELPDCIALDAVKKALITLGILRD